VSEYTGDLIATIDRLERELPGWWFTMGKCDLTCHATVGPDRAFIGEPALSKYDRGFSADLPNPSTLAEALGEAIDLAIVQIALDRTPGAIMA
jgi:hypothetical protein